MNKSVLLAQAKNYVKQKTGTLPVLAKETGVDYNWLRKLADGSIKDPGVSKIETLLRHANKSGIKTALR